MTYLAQLKAKLSESAPLLTPDKTDKRLQSVLSVALGGGFPNTEFPSVSSVSGLTGRILDDHELAMLLDLPAGWTVNNWFDFEERAAILELDGGLDRSEAERLALVQCGLSMET